MMIPDTVRLYGLDLWNIDPQTCARRIIDARDPATPHAIYFINAHCVNVAATDPDYRAALHRAHALLPDGAGMELSARLAGFPGLANLNGTDMFPHFLAEASRAGLRVGLVGAKPGIAEACRQNLQLRFPALHFGIVADGYQPAEKLAALIRANPPDLLFVAMGVPMQEMFIDRYREALGVPLLLAVGALFDFYSGNVTRAPRIVRVLRLEWAYRMMLEPKRLWRRYLIGNIVFLARMARLRLHGRGCLSNDL
jgi:exopolysaccharide biosynthesis WecB/TagA/CpsF family protein